MSADEIHSVKDRLSSIYLEQLKQRSEILTTIYSGLKSRSASKADYALLALEAHKLAGTGTTYGYPAISLAAEPLDVSLQRVDPSVEEVSELLRTLLQAVEQALSGHPGSPSAAIETAPAPAPAVVPPPKGYRPSILVADDDPAIQSLLAELLAAFAIVQIVGTGSEALAAMRTTRFDLVLLDHRLPDMDGHSVIGAMRTSGKSAQTIVMMLTAVRDGVEVAKLLLAGAADYVIKPFHPGSLMKRVQTVISNRTPTVLVADDDRLVREVLHKKFRDRGINVLFASNGVDALSIARAERPQLVLLDIGMPRLDGIGVLNELKSNAETKETPVVILSARTTSRDVSEALNRGANLYIVKPFLPDDAIGQCAAFLFPPRASAA
jgi:DNA-binding response OmpR family regulator